MAKTKIPGEYLKDSVVRFTAKAGENITKGQAIYISGISGEVPVVSLADADDTNKMPAFGLAESTVSTNGSVEITSNGTLAGIDTSSYALGDILYISTTAGSLTNDPSGLEASKVQNIGMVQRIHASNGSIKVGGAGRTNATPNLNDGNIFVGNSSNKSVSDAFTDVLNDQAGISVGGSGIDVTGVITSDGLTLQTSENTVSWASGNGVIEAPSNLYLRSTGSGTIYLQDNVDVTGTVTADSFQVDDTDDIRLRFLNASTFKGGLQIATTAGDMIGTSEVDDLCIRGQSNILFATGGNTERVSIASNGDISFYNTAGTSQALFWDASAESLGIGTTSPESTLEVAKSDQAGGSTLSITNSFTGADWNTGDLIGSINFRTDDTSTSQPIRGSIKSIVENTSGATSPAYTALSFSTAAVNTLSEAMRIDSSGNVGIGLSPYANSISSGIDSVNGLGLFGYNDGFYVSGNAYYNGAWKYKTSGFASKINSNSTGDVTISGAVSGSTDGTITWADNVTIQNSGNVGIGTSSPNATLHVASSSAKIAEFERIGNQVFDLTISDIGEGAGQLWFNAQTNDTGFNFRPKSSGGTNTNALYIAPDGDIGIGTTSPSATLDVNGTIKLNGNYPTGTQNTALGNNVLVSLTTGGNYNVGIGHSSLTANTSGERNVGVGRTSLNANTTGSYNSALGMSSLVANTTGSYNTAVGQASLDANTTASNNTAVGYASLSANTTGESNVAVGSQCLDANTTGLNNTAVGRQALDNNTTGSQNVAVGTNALDANTTANSNTAVGTSALRANTTASGNVAVGFNAMQDGTTSANSTAVGYEALANVTTVNGNHAFGFRALKANTSGSGNTAVGGSSLAANTTGEGNTSVGGSALDANTTGSYNQAFGENCLTSNTTGAGNIAIGRDSMAACSTGARNTAIGAHGPGVNYGALYNLTTGTQNCAMGTGAGVLSTTGSNNVLLGFNAGSNITTGVNNICIGSSTQTQVAGSENNIVIGVGISGGENSQFRFGSSSNTVSNEFDTDAAWTRASDIRKKRNIKDDTLGLEFINDLSTKTFQWKPSNEFPKEWDDYNEENKMNLDAVMHGLIAQDVKSALDKQGVDTFGGWVEGKDGMQNVSREMFVTPLIKAIQELSTQVDELKAEIQTLKGE